MNKVSDNNGATLLSEQPQSDSTRRLLTAEQVAKIICCSRKTTYRWAELGHIPSIKIGAGRKALLRFDSDEVHAWLQPGKGKQQKGIIRVLELLPVPGREGRIYGHLQERQHLLDDKAVPQEEGRTVT